MINDNDLVKSTNRTEHSLESLGEQRGLLLLCTAGGVNDQLSCFDGQQTECRRVVVCGVLVVVVGGL